MWIQRPARTALADSDTTEYRGCLDALIATIADMQAAADALDTLAYNYGGAHYGPANDAWIAIAEARRRAADCAHRLFERWIEVAKPCEEFCGMRGCWIFGCAETLPGSKHR